MDRPTLTVGAFDAVALGAVSLVIIVSVGLGVMLGMTLGCNRGHHRTRRGRPAQITGGAPVVSAPAPLPPVQRAVAAVRPAEPGSRPDIQWERGWDPAARAVAAAGRRVDDAPGSTVRLLRTGEHDAPGADTYRVAVSVAGVVR